MNEPDYADLQDEDKERLNELFDQYLLKIEDLMKEHGPDHVMRLFTPKKKDYLKPPKK
jgi:hypothetical protein